MRHTRAFAHAPFRPRLAATPLRFANHSPPSGWVEDLHSQAVKHARHTKKAPRARGFLRAELAAFCLYAAVRRQILRQDRCCYHSSRTTRGSSRTRTPGVRAAQPDSILVPTEHGGE